MGLATGAGVRKGESRRSRGAQCLPVPPGRVFPRKHPRGTRCGAGTAGVPGARGVEPRAARGRPARVRGQAAPFCSGVRAYVSWMGR